MRLLPSMSIALIALTSLMGCGSSSQQTSGSDGTPPAAAPPAASAPAPETTAAIPDKSPYDSGPRASADGPVDKAAAERGEKLFATKGCTTCHGFGRKVLCPDLNGITRLRTAEWMRNQILHPEVMTKTDPIAHQLLVETKLQMTNQHLTEAEAKDVVQFLKSHDAGGH